MGVARDEILRLVESLPDDATWEDVQYSVYVRERIERGRREAAEGKLIDQEEIERRMEKWTTE